MLIWRKEGRAGGRYGKGGSIVKKHDDGGGGENCVICQQEEHRSQLHPLCPLSSSLPLSFVNFSPLNIN